MTLLIIFLIIVAVAFIVWLISRRRPAKPEPLPMVQEKPSFVAPVASPLPSVIPQGETKEGPVPASPATPPPPESSQSNNFTI